jgi:hypothetical protein
MSNPLIERKPDKPPALPPVEAPSASFLLQLFLIPLVIVIIIVMVWLLFSWLAHMGSNPRDLVRDIGRVNDASWQRAYNLAELMRKPQYEHLKDDHKLAEDLAATLTTLRDSRPARKRDAAKETDEERRLRKDNEYENRIKLEIFLCKVLGEFRVTDGLSALVAAAEAEEAQDPEGIAVRVAALGALAVQAGEVDVKTLRDHPRLIDTVIDASKERGESSNGREEYDKLRSAAAYTLGMIGGTEALDRSAQMLDDASANVRYNAALGLARHGDARALPVLGEMLDPNNTEGLDDPDVERKGSEAYLASGKSWKRVSIMSNAIRGARMLVENRREGDYTELIGWLKKVEASNMMERVKLDAKGLRLELEQKSAKAA